MSEDREHEPREGLTRAEEHAVEEHLKLRAPAIYEVVRREAMLSILPAFIGNVVGGTGLFALIAYGQVREEL